MNTYNYSIELPIISFITIAKSNSKELMRTIRSLINQHNEENIEYIIVISEKLSIFIKNIILEKKNSIKIKLIESKDHGLYDAMNLGILSSTGKYIYFLNSGDLLLDKKLKLIYSYIKEKDPSECLAFSTIQTMDENKWLRKSKNFNRYSFLFRELLPPHQGFLSPNTKKRSLFNTKLKLTADSFWIRESIRTYGVVYFNEAICEFKLKGVSNFPSIKLIKLRIYEKKYLLSILELLKFAIHLLIRTRNYYSLIFLLKGFKKISD